MAANKREKKVDDPDPRTRTMRDTAEKKLAHTPKRGHDLTGQTPEELIHELILGVRQ